MANFDCISYLEQSSPVANGVRDWVARRWTAADGSHALACCGDMLHGAGMAARSVDFDVAMELWFLADIAVTKALLIVEEKLNAMKPA